MIQIEDGFVVPPTRRTDKNKITPGLKNLMVRYSDAYQRVYGVPARVLWENPWFKIIGVTGRVSRSRLLEMTRQLEYRAG